MKYRNLVFSVCFLSVMLLAQVGRACPAGLTCGPATVYEVTVQQIELCTGTSGTDCLGSAVIGSGTLSVDIASAAAGAQVATYGTVENLQVGSTYTHVRVTVATSFNISGTTPDPGAGDVCVTNGGTGTITSPLGVAAGPGTATTSTLAVPTVAAVGASSDLYTSQGMVHNGSTLTMVAALPTPLVVATSMPSVDIAFDTSEGLGSVAAGGNCLLFPAPPTISVTQN